MGLMQKLRSSTKYIIWLLILSFGLLWVLADTQVFDAMMAGPRNMGEVNREPITYVDFNRRVNFFTEQHREQTGASPDSEVRAQYEEMAWDQLVVDKILKQKMEEMGITVTDLELVEMVTGENPDPFIRQQFTREDGTIDRVALHNAIEAPENREIWILIEQQLREQRRQQKLSHFIEASLRVSDLEVMQHYVNQNSRADFRYLRFPYAEVSSDDIMITDADIQAYYRRHQDRFQRDKSWRFSYVTFSILPTSEDTIRTIRRLANLQDAFAQSTNVRRFLTDNYSETSYSESFLNPSEIRPEHRRVLELKPGEVSDPYVHQNRVHMVRLLEERPSDKEYVHVRQIRLRDDDTGREQAVELLGRARAGESFADLARSYSRDAATSRGGGDLGYIARDDKPARISRALFNASAGSFVGPLDGDDGIYLFEVAGRSQRDVRFADMSQDVQADPFETVQRLANEAEDFQYFASSDGFRREAERSGYQVMEGFATERNPFIPGLGQSRIILSELAMMRRGEISDVIETEDQFIIFQIDEIIPEGARPLEEVRAQVESLVRDQKRREITLKRVAELQQGMDTLEELAQKSEKEIVSAERIRLSSSTIPGAGREAKIVGAAFSLPLETLSKPIPGNNAVFVMMVDARTMANTDNLTSAERRQIREQLQQQKNAAFGNVWVERLKADAAIRDFRIHQRLMQPM